MPSTYTKAKKSQVNEPFFVTTKSSVEKIMNTAAFHGRICKSGLTIKKVTKRGHVSVLKLVCSCTSRKHTYMWSSSPFMQNGKYLVNQRINHAFVCCGMLPSHYARFATAAGIGVMSVKQRDSFCKKFKVHVEEEYKASTNDALLEEIGCYEDLTGIDIITDARHGWRKNAKDTSVVAVGSETHKMLTCATVTKQDDHVAQRHEKIGTQKIYDHLDSQNVTVRIHAHDRNMAINKMVKDKVMTTNQNDAWHGVKAVKKALTVVSSEPRYLKGKTWSDELKDKVEPVATRFHSAIRNCGGDSSALRNSLDNIIDHYENRHDNCNQSSRCKRDKNYEPSRVVIEDPQAEKLLRGVIRDSVIYKNPDDFNLGRDTFLLKASTIH